jgi:hypothetical protein
MMGANIAAGLLQDKDDIDTEVVKTTSATTPCPTAVSCGMYTVSNPFPSSSALPPKP